MTTPGASTRNSSSANSLTTRSISSFECPRFENSWPRSYAGAILAQSRISPGELANRYWRGAPKTRILSRSAPVTCWVSTEPSRQARAMKNRKTGVRCILLGSYPIEHFRPKESSRVWRVGSQCGFSLLNTSEDLIEFSDSGKIRPGPESGPGDPSCGDRQSRGDQCEKRNPFERRSRSAAPTVVVASGAAAAGSGGGGRDNRRGGWRRGRRGRGGGGLDVAPHPILRAHQQHVASDRGGVGHPRSVGIAPCGRRRSTVGPVPGRIVREEGAGMLGIGLIVGVNVACGADNVGGADAGGGAGPVAGREHLPRRAFIARFSDRRPRRHVPGAARRLPGLEAAVHMLEAAHHRPSRRADRAVTELGARGAADRSE